MLLNKIPSRVGNCVIGILTITEQEFACGQRIFGLRHNIPDTGYFVEQGQEPKNHDIVLRRSAERANYAAGRAIRQMIEDWRPACIMLVGTAGGVLQRRPLFGPRSGTVVGREGINLGDVVVADFIEYVEFAKLEGGRIRQRKLPHDHPSLYLRENFAEVVRGETYWHRWIGVARPDGTSDPPVVRIGNICASEKILSDCQSSYQNQVIDSVEKALAFETESFGVASEVFSSRSSIHYNPQFLTIRGISDFVNSKRSESERRGWTEYAASCALAFARRVAERLLSVVGSAT